MTSEINSPKKKDGLANEYSEISKIPLVREFEESLRDAQILLAYTCRNGLVVPDEVIETLTLAKALVDSDKLTVQDEARFWKAYSILSNLALPVSVESLKATKGSLVTYKSVFTGKDKKRWESPAKDAVKKYKRLTICVFLFVLVTQIYWFVGTTALNDFEYIAQQSNEIELELNNRNSIRIKRGEVRAYQALPQDEAKTVRLKKLQEDLKVLELRANKKFADSYSVDLESKLKNLNNSWDTNNEILERWSKLWKIVVAIPLSVLEWFDPDNDEDLRLEDSIQAEVSPVIKKLISVNSGNFVLYAIQSYLLPLLYGWLGALIFVLRTLPHEITELTFSEKSKTIYSLRLYLGALAGLAIILFPSDPNHTVISPEYSGIGLPNPSQNAEGASGQNGVVSTNSLSPLALAFLAGYSVELLFTAMDKFVYAFTGEGKKSKEK